MARPDPHSYYDSSQPTVKHIGFNFRVDFDNKIMDCQASLVLDRPGTELYLDTRDLLISNIEDNNGNSIEFSLEAPDQLLGSRLTIKLLPKTSTIHIWYTTSPNASGLQWLTPRQADSRYPFMFSQGQCIHTRSFLPCQDTPTVRVTFEATLTVPNGLRGLMAAKQLGSSVGDHEVSESWRMNRQIPTYLIALAVGELEERKISDSTTLYAQPQMIEAAAYEFAEMPEIMAAAVELFGNYPWEGFNLLVLPRSFPYGGMENPTLTFLSPSIVVGDRSQVDVVAHELAHSWTGNLVTNSTWRDFWLNEGWTTWAQFRIVEAVWGHDTAMLQAACLMQEMHADFDRFKKADTPKLTYLETPADGSRDPDEAFSRVPYMKGYLFIRRLEETFGREVFDHFVRHYIDRFAFRSISTDDFLNFFNEAFPDVLSILKYEEWIEGPYLPSSGVPSLEAPTLTTINQIVAEYRCPTADESATWNSSAWLYYLGELAELSNIENTAPAIALLRARFEYHPNADLRAAWLMAAHKAKVPVDHYALREFLCSVGRLKFLRPLYVEFGNDPMYRSVIKSAFYDAESGYHPVVQSIVGKLLATSEPALTNP